MCVRHVVVCFNYCNTKRLRFRGDLVSIIQQMMCAISDVNREYIIIRVVLLEYCYIEVVFISVVEFPHFVLFLVDIVEIVHVHFEYAQSNKICFGLSSICRPCCLSCSRHSCHHPK